MLLKVVHVSSAMGKSSTWDIYIYLGHIFGILKTVHISALSCIVARSSLILLFEPFSHMKQSGGLYSIQYGFMFGLERNYVTETSSRKAHPNPPAD